MTNSGKGPSRVWYWVGGGLILAGMVAAIVWAALGLAGLSDEVDGFARVPIDGGGGITLSDPGDYTVYYEAPAGDESGSVPGFEAALSATGGEPVKVTEYDGSLTYDFGDHSGQAIATFEIAEPGAYLLESSSSGSGELAVGPGVGGRLATTVVGAVLLGLGGFVVGVVILIVTAVKRHSARKRAGPAPGASWPPQAPPASPAPGSSWPPPSPT